MQYFLENNTVYATHGHISLYYNSTQGKWLTTNSAKGRQIDKEQAMALTKWQDTDSAMQEVYAKLYILKQASAQNARQKIASRLAQIEEALRECNAFGAYATELYGKEMQDLEEQRKLLLCAVNNDEG